MAGPLTGTRVVELAGIGPAPFCGMVLADQGAEVIRIDRVAPGLVPDLAGRGRRSVIVDLKSSDGVEVALRLLETADALLEGYRPGVLERLGLGPEACLRRNPRLVYARMTGWGQEGPLAGSAGHDIDYIALSGALHAVGRAGERPVPPLNLVADYGGGGMLLAFGVVAALLEAARTGRGQVVDAAMVDGAALLMTAVYELSALGRWRDERGVNLLDGGAPFYDTYETADGGAVAVGPLEPRFYEELVELLGLEVDELPEQYDEAGWPELRRRLSDVFRTRTRAEWEAILGGSDACAAPVLSLEEAPRHPHNRARETFVEVGGVLQPGPAPRFTNHPRRVPRPAPVPGADTDEVLRSLGFDEEEILRLRALGAVG